MISICIYDQSYFLLYICMPISRTIVIYKNINGLCHYSSPVKINFVWLNAKVIESLLWSFFILSLFYKQLLWFLCSSFISYLYIIRFVFAKAFLLLSLASQENFSWHHIFCFSLSGSRAGTKQSRDLKMVKHRGMINRSVEEEKEKFLLSTSLLLT